MTPKTGGAGPPPALLCGTSVRWAPARLKSESIKCGELGATRPDLGGRKPRGDGLAKKRSLSSYGELGADLPDFGGRKPRVEGYATKKDVTGYGLRD